MGSVKNPTSIDLCSGYWQCHISDKDILKTTFFMRYSLYKWVVMPMGLTNAPTTFMWTINNLFSNILDSGVAVFLDDILVYLHTVKEQFMLLEKVLVLLYQYTFYCKLKKCSFLYNSRMFLSFNTIPEGMHISDSKVQSLNEWLVPTTVQLVLSFLGFVQCFYRFIHKSSANVEPLHKLRCKNDSFAWLISIDSQRT